MWHVTYTDRWGKVQIARVRAASRTEAIRSVAASAMIGQHAVTSASRISR